MKRIISMPLAAGGTVGLEIEDGQASPVMRGTPQQIVEKTTESFEAALARVKPVAAAIVEQFASAIHGTSSVKVKFGLKFNAEAGAIIASLGSEANFEIEVTWAREAT
jgi:hypothetical protein